MRVIDNLVLAVGLVCAAGTSIAPFPTPAIAAASPEIAVGSQYSSTHVYVAPEDLDRFVTSFIATFGGTASQTAVMTVTPTPSSTVFRAALTPVGILTVFGFKTPVPYPFGQERTGYLVIDMDEAVRAAGPRAPVSS